jgi:hypothetical protein
MVTDVPAMPVEGETLKIAGVLTVNGREFERTPPC